MWEICEKKFLIPHCVLVEYPEYLSCWWTSGRWGAVKHCQRKMVSGYWSDPSHRQASREEEINECSTMVAMEKNQLMWGPNNNCKIKIPVLFTNHTWAPVFILVIGALMRIAVNCITSTSTWSWRDERVSLLSIKSKGVTHLSTLFIYTYLRYNNQFPSLSINQGVKWSQILRGIQVLRIYVLFFSQNWRIFKNVQNMV